MCRIFGFLTLEIMLFVHAMSLVQEPTLHHRVNTPCASLKPVRSGKCHSWLIPSLDFTLQQSPDLSNWTDVPNTPVLNLTNLQNRVTLPSPFGDTFFRLVH